MSLRYRIAVTIFVLEAVLIAALLRVTLSHSLRSIRDQLTASENVAIQLISNLSRAALLTEDYAEVQSFIDATVRDPRIVRVVLLDRRGRIVVATERDLIGQPLPALSDRDQRYWRTTEVRGYANPLGKLAIEFSDLDLITAYREATNLGLIVALAGMAAIAVVGLTIGVVLTRRLQALASAADTVGRDGGAFRFAVTGRDEVARLARAFASTVRRLHDSMAQLKRARDLLVEPTEAMSQGFALWDAKNRLVLCNTRFRELFSEIADHVVVGVGFPELVARLQDQIESRGGNPETAWAWLARRLGSSGSPQTVGELDLGPDRQIEVRESRTREGGIVAICTDVTARKAAEREILHHATHDTLTNLPNRSLFEDRLTSALAQARRSGETLAVMVMDVDRFKVVNDRRGHPVGDALLVALSRRVLEMLRADDTMSRLGGDEFVFILRDVVNREGAEASGRRLVDAVRQPFAILGHDLHVTISLGISMFPSDGERPEDLLKNADVALYRAKSGGRDQAQVFDAAMSAGNERQMAIETALRAALERGQLQLAYQPQIDLNSHTIIGVEALLRWMHPDFGFVSPSEFIPLAEATGLIHPLGDWVLRTACTDAAAWAGAAAMPLRLAVNLSARQFQRPGFSRHIAETIDASGLARPSVEFELTESVLMHDGDGTGDQLTALDGMGFGLVLDDFGTGYSSLSHLKRYPIRRIKIDRSFVADIERNANDAALVRATVAMAECMGIGVVAEGIETTAQLTMLHGFGCCEGQGFLTGHPVAADEIARLLRKHAAARPGGGHDRRSGEPRRLSLVTR